MGVAGEIGLRQTGEVVLSDGLAARNGGFLVGAGMARALAVPIRTVCDANFQWLFNGDGVYRPGLAAAPEARDSLAPHRMGDSECLHRVDAQDLLSPLRWNGDCRDAAAQPVEQCRYRGLIGLQRGDHLG
ncbi:MAG: hypothetical protein EXR77_19930 [Myxococcales bacterium]|nr:hypothetical protein [Myxococcales bacterium]